MKKTLFCLAIFCLMATSIFAQKKIKNKGHVTYKMEMSRMGEEPETAAILGDMTIEIYMSGKDTRMNINAMGGMIKIGYIQKDGEKPVTLMDMMGQKMRQNAEEQAPASVPDMTYAVNKRNTKKIAGYKCHQVVATADDGTEVILYVTKKIKLNLPKGGMLDIIDFDKFDGYPLECSIGGEGEAITFTAQEVGRDLEKNTFEYDKEAYKEMSDEEMGGMGLDPGIIGL